MSETRADKKKRYRKEASKGWKKKGRKGKKQKTGDTDDRQSRDPSWAEVDYSDPANNKHFIPYYKAQNLMPEEEFDAEFMPTCIQNLPNSFRLSSINGFASPIKKILLEGCVGFDAEVKLSDGTVIQPPYPLAWYPGQSAWQVNASKKQLKAPEIRPFRQFIIREFDSGNLNRQEVVSMIPPLLLDVQPDHNVLDMCAAPGSKTLQLIEALHRDAPPEGPSGLVVANDADVQRASMLVHQLQKYHSPNYIVTSHDARFFPAIFQHAPSQDAIVDSEEFDNAQLLFDRVLADVPCSGDGTCRKNVHAFKNWNIRQSLALHGLQLDIAERGLRRLKVGGFLVYSTCTFNPLENEAVVAQLVRFGQGSVEVVDVSDKLQGLQREAGLSTWRVALSNEDIENGVYVDDFKTADRSKWHKMMRESMFPPETKQEADALGLSKCVRVLPHKQNTGGFFIALLHKTSYLPGEQEKRDKRNARLERKNASSSSSSSSAVPVEIDTEVLPELAEDAKKELEVRGEVRPVRFGDKFFDSHVGCHESNINGVSQFYGIPDEFQLSQHLLARSSAEEQRKMYLVLPKVHQMLTMRLNDRVKVLHTGVRCFEAVNRRGEKYFRLCTEGINQIGPYLTKQIVDIPEPEAIVGLSKKSVMLTDIKDKTFLEALNQQENGSVALRMRGERTAAITGSLDLPLFLIGWKSDAALSIGVNKAMKDSLAAHFVGSEGEAVDVEEESKART